MLCITSKLLRGNNAKRHEHFFNTMLRDFLVKPNLLALFKS